jgi:hypothetical protein
MSTLDSRNREFYIRQVIDCKECKAFEIEAGLVNKSKPLILYITNPGRFENIEEGSRLEVEVVNEEELIKSGIIHVHVYTVRTSN